jgi:hypothetical protein
LAPQSLAGHLEDAMVAVARKDDLLMLILVKQKSIFPLNRSALTRTQFSPTRVNDEYRNALLLERDGLLYEIQNIECLGTFGKRPFERLLNALSGTREIKIDSKPACIEFSRLREMIAEIVLSGGVGGDPESSLEERRDVADQVLRSTDVSGIFDAMKLPPVDDALDVL